MKINEENCKPGKLKTENWNGRKVMKLLIITLQFQLKKNKQTNKQTNKQNNLLTLTIS